MSSLERRIRRRQGKHYTRMLLRARKEALAARSKETGQTRAEIVQAWRDGLLTIDVAAVGDEQDGRITGKLRPTDADERLAARRYRSAKTVQARLGKRPRRGG